ncbi:MAG: hypothetical protein ACTSP4_00465 [Candidatus Hodarchaeales archaeon]
MFKQEDSEHQIKRSRSGPIYENKSTVNMPFSLTNRAKKIINEAGSLRPESSPLRRQMASLNLWRDAQELEKEASPDRYFIPIVPRGTKL